MGDRLGGPEIFLHVGRQKALSVRRLRGRGMQQGSPDKRDGAVAATIGKAVAVDIVDHHPRAPDQSDGRSTGQTGFRR